MPGRSFAREPLEPTSTAFPGDDGGDTLQTIINSEVKGSSLVLVVPCPREFPSSHAFTPLYSIPAKLCPSTPALPPLARQQLQAHNSPSLR
jgi:hypothetical protein